VSVASAKFDAAASGPPGELLKASHEYTEAIQKFTEALKARHDFVVKGTIPPNLP
jgi:hypothetical protein